MTTAMNTSTNNRAPVRLYSKDVKEILSKNPKFTRFPFRLPKPIYVNLNTIEDLVRIYKNKPELLDINFVETLGLSKELIDELQAKALELCEMIDNADNDDYEHHLSRGSLDNVGLTCLRRVFYVAAHQNPALEEKFKSTSFKPRKPKANPNPYPFVEADPLLLVYLSQLFLRIYDAKLQHQVLPFYFAVLLQLCCYTKFVGFGVDYPIENVGIRWEEFYDSVFMIVENSKIVSPGDYRPWTKKITTNAESTVVQNQSLNDPNAFPELQ